jgi:hypothetical protein
MRSRAAPPAPVPPSPEHPSPAPLPARERRSAVYTKMVEDAILFMLYVFDMILPFSVLKMVVPVSIWLVLMVSCMYARTVFIQNQMPFITQNRMDLSMGRNSTIANSVQLLDVSKTGPSQ